MWTIFVCFALTIGESVGTFVIDILCGIYDILTGSARKKKEAEEKKKKEDMEKAFSLSSLHQLIGAVPVIPRDSVDPSRPQTLVQLNASIDGGGGGGLFNKNVFLNDSATRVDGHIA